MDLANDVASMLSSCKDVESAEIPNMLEQIAYCIHSSGKQSEFCSIDADDGVAWLWGNCRKAHDLLQGFLTKHGHRAFAEVSYIFCIREGVNETKHIFDYSSRWQR